VPDTLAAQRVIDNHRANLGQVVPHYVHGTGSQNAVVLVDHNRELLNLLEQANEFVVLKHLAQKRFANRLDGAHV
jgi:hypothetical protein